jgi:D-alanyl-D-alanine carboxypeptidase
LFLIVLFLVAVPQVVRAGPTLVFDVESGTVLQSDNAGAAWYPASLTKLMTAYVTFHALRQGRLTLDSKLTMSENARAEPPSKVGLPVGAEFTVDWALQVLIVRSANDIAVALAEGVGGTEARFVQIMNDAAQRLAMTGTYFTNPHGLPDRRQTTTARDMGLLARAIIREFPQYQGYFEAPTVRIGGRNLSNRNNLLRTMPDADGMKTGFICNSGYNLVASATREGRRLVAVVFGASNGGARTTTAQALLEQGFIDQQASGLLSLRRKLNELSNGTGMFSVSAAPPEDMTQTVCRGQGAVRLTQADVVRGWSVVLGRAEAASDAQALLERSLAPLRSVFYGGRAVVVKAPDTGLYTAMVHALEAAQTTAICARVMAGNGACEVLPPDAYRAVIARLEEEERQRAEARREQRRAEQAATAAASAAAAAAQTQATQSATQTQSASQPATEQRPATVSPQPGHTNPIEGSNAASGADPGSDLTMDDLR